ncbi:MAG TPA: carcinine hydrolase/isopenicillin-N N-acyltransferase family protein [Ilumatobacteraceae bacterium]|nr:carcinine hydrolase/isopenicillin-N N-acyltransferase family protein [Ilumatobacteraceae bacterium]
MCDTLVSITSDGVLFAKNSDRDPNEAQIPRWYPAADHDSAPGDIDCTWISIPQVEHTHAVLLSQPWWMWGAEMGANEHGVVIGNEAVFTNQPLGDAALLGMDLLRLALERAATADDAVAVIVDLLERHGQGGPCSHEKPGFAYHNSFLVADPTGAIVLETAGTNWAVETVTGRGRSISNGLTIAGFADEFTSTTAARNTSCTMRRARTQPAAEAAVGVADLFAALRDHGGGAAPVWSVTDGAMGAPCVHAGGEVSSSQSTASWVSDLRSDPLHWVTATSAPCTSTFHPVRVDQPIDRAAPFGDPTNRFDAASRWWTHELLHRRVLRDHEASVGRFAAERDALERTWIDDPPESELAFVASAAVERQWLAELVAADLGDVRPPWLVDLWHDLDLAAGVPTLDSPS